MAKSASLIETDYATRQLQVNTPFVELRVKEAIKAYGEKLSESHCNDKMLVAFAVRKALKILLGHRERSMYHSELQIAVTNVVKRAAASHGMVFDHTKQYEVMSLVR